MTEQGDGAAQDSVTHNGAAAHADSAQSEARHDDEAARRLWRLWEERQQPNLIEFVAGAGRLDPLELAAVVRVDQRQRWLLGERLEAEHYLQAFPAVTTDREAVLDIIYAEFLLRRECGEAVTPGRFLDRFPQFVDDLRLQLDLGEALATEPIAPAEVVDKPRRARAQSAEEAPRRPAAVRPPETSDRNLLFGILALQMDFITRDSLIAAMHAWVLAKEKALGEILVQNKALGTDERELLENLVKKHLKRHGNDTELSLRSIDSVGSIEDQLKKIGDSEVQASLAHISRRRPFKGAPLDLAAEVTETSDVLPIKADSRFRILRAHAEGGLGRVHVARDEELHREVALKEIKEKYADNAENRKRFVLEAEITGGLEHPGIVPVYARGQFPDGRPFYTMRLIKGESLKEAIANYHQAKKDSTSAPSSRAPGTSLTLRQLLLRFIDVCEAVAYAHSRGVVHRDLKPGNIMLGKYGETLVVDWGLGKPVGRSESAPDWGEVTNRPPASDEVTPTEMGALVGTLEFMSPEQARGWNDRVGPQSDIYSLGATLYALLAGQPPVTGSYHEKLHNAQDGLFAPPRNVNAAIPAALQAICLKALARRPEDRYTTALELAEDVEHWLADEPVHAWPEPFWARAARWMRHHRAIIAGVVALLITAVIALTISTVLVSRHQRQTDLARLKTLTSLELLTQVTEEQLVELPSMETTLQEISKLLDGTHKDHDRAREIPLVHYRLGKAWKRLGYYQNAITQFQQASEIFPRIRIETPDDDPRYWVAVCHGELGDTLRRKNSAQAETEFTAAAHLYAALAAERGAQAKCLHAAARNGNNYGIWLLEANRTEEAAAVLRQAFDFLKQLEKMDGSKPDYRADLAQVLINLGCLHEIQNPEECPKDYHEAIQLLERLQKETPTNWENLDRLALACNNLAQLPVTEPADSRKLLQEAIEYYRRLTINFPKNDGFKRGLGLACYNLGQLHWDSGRKQQAKVAWEEAYGVWKDIAADPGYHEYLSLYGCVLQNLGVYARSEGALGEARTFLESAVVQQTQARSMNPKNQRYADDLCRHYRTLIDTVVKQKDQAQARAIAAALVKEFSDQPRQSFAAAQALAKWAAKGQPADYLGPAVILLKHVLERGFKTPQELDGNADNGAPVFQIFRPLPAYQQLLHSEKTALRDQTP